MTPPQGPRLDSWKAIADYLGRNVRTATRWYVERGLPVHHIPGGKRSHVFAFAAELDAWLLSQTLGPPPVSSSSPANQIDCPAAQVAQEPVLGPPVAQPTGTTTAYAGNKPATRAPTLRRFRLPSVRWRIVLAAGLFLAVASAVSLALHPSDSHASQLFALKFDVDTLTATNAEGHTLWSHRYPDSTFTNYFASRGDGKIPVRIADFFHDGNREAAAIVPLHKGPDPEQHNSSELDFFSSRGDLLWRYVPTGTFQFGTHELSGPWFFLDLFVSQSGPQTTIWATSGHHTWGDAQVSQINPRNGQAALRFVNTGVLYRLNELRTSSGTFLLAAGFNNEWDGGSLAIVNEDRPFASSPQTPGTRHHCDSCPPGAPDYYFVFPRSEINRISGVYEDPIFDVAIVNEGIQVRKFERLNRGGENVIYTFSKQPPFKLRSVLYDSDYDMLHKKWSMEGKISHSLEDCPERLHPLPIRVWTPTSGWTNLPVLSAAADQ